MTRVHWDLSKASDMLFEIFFKELKGVWPIVFSRKWEKIRTKCVGWSRPVHMDLFLEIQELWAIQAWEIKLFLFLFSFTFLFNLVHSLIYLLIYFLISSFNIWLIINWTRNLFWFDFFFQSPWYLVGF